ncbi:MAG: hypothetical protein ABSB96_02675 [Gaiellaceae bacterium]
MKAVVGVVVIAIASLVPALALADKAHGLALLAYAILLAALFLMLVIDRLRKALPRAPYFESSPSRNAEQGSVAQFDRIKRALMAASWNESHLYESLRPIAREIVAARLLRHHGVDLDRSPELAYAIVGDGYAWDLVRPDREPPAGAGARGWSRGELDKLLDELEAL